jgi:hypothetical protein
MAYPSPADERDDDVLNLVLFIADVVFIVAGVALWLVGLA